MDLRVGLAFARFDRAELKVCRYLNRSSRLRLIRHFFRGISWLGDGWFWYALILALPFAFGSAGAVAAVQMIVTGALGIALYRLIKERAVRERPFITHPSVSCAAAPLDRYSFPSGHTLHAVSFTTLTASHFPELGTPLAGFAFLVALSRVVLGLHYPTDVAAGAILGGLLAAVSLGALPLVVGA